MLMDKNYYLKNMLIGWGIGCLFIFISLTEKLWFGTVLLSVGVAGMVLFPISKWAVERFFLKFTSPEFWNRGFFMDTPAKNGLIAIFWLFSFVFSVPVSVLAALVKATKKGC